MFDVKFDTATNTKTLHPPITPGGSVVSPEYVVRVSPKYTDNAYPQFANYLSAIAYLEGIVTSTQKGLIIIEEGTFDVLMKENISIIALRSARINNFFVGDKANNYTLSEYPTCYIDCNVNYLKIENDVQYFHGIFRDVAAINIQESRYCNLTALRTDIIQMFNNIDSLKLTILDKATELSVDGSCALTNVMLDIKELGSVTIAGTGELNINSEKGDTFNVGGSIKLELNNCSYRFLAVNTVSNVLLQHNIIDNLASHAISLADEAKLTIKDSWIRGMGGSNGAILCLANSTGRFIISSSYIHSSIYSIASLRPNRQVWIYSPSSSNVPVDSNVLIDGYPIFNVNTNFQWFN